MLVPGNSKLGRSVFSFSIPAVFTCPGKTKACEAVCYAKRGYFAMGSTKKSHRRNWRRTLRSSFVAEVVAEVHAKKAKVVRVHTAGDFFSAKYTRKWIEIAKQCPHTIFYAYTRSYRVPRIRKAIRELSRLPNVRLWLSVDKYSGPIPRWKTVRIAYMLTAGEDYVPVPASLIFRVSRRGVKNPPQKFIDGRLVCPAEQGIERQHFVGCSECRLCFEDRPIPQKLLQLELA